jgi:hypothetical protein
MLGRLPRRVSAYGALMSEAFVAIRYAPAMVPMFRLLGLGPARSGVWVGRDSLRVTMGWGFRAEIPRRAVREIGPDGAAVGGWGVHGWRGRWLVNGSSSGLVRLEIEPEVQAWVMGIPVRLRTLRLSLVAPGELTSMLRDHC